MINHIGTCELETKRLVLRRFKREDALMVFNNWTSDKEVTTYVAWPTHRNVQTTVNVLTQWERAYRNPKTYQWAIVLKKTGEVIGSISLFNIVSLREKDESVCEFGYCLSRKYWNQGLTTEAAFSVLRFAFEQVGFNRIKARHDVLNIASGRVMQKLGMQYERLLKSACQNGKGKWIDCDVYKIQKQDFLTLNQKSGM